MKIAQLRLLAAGIFLFAAGQLSATLTYYYNSLDSNPDQFTGTLTVPSYFPNQPVPILTFSMSAVVDGQTLSYTTADQTGPAEAMYDANPADPLSLLYPYPGYFTLNPVLGGQQLVLGPQTPAASSLGAPMIFTVPSSPIDVTASDNGVWLLTAPLASVPETTATVPLFGLAIITALSGFTRFHGRDRALSC